MLAVLLAPLVWTLAPGTKAADDDEELTLLSAVVAAAEVGGVALLPPPLPPPADTAFVCLPAPVAAGDLVLGRMYLL